MTEHGQVAVVGGNVHGVGVADVIINRGMIAAIGPDLGNDARTGGAVLDATGCLVAPGLIDLLTDDEEEEQDEDDWGTWPGGSGSSEWPDWRRKSRARTTWAPRSARC